MRNRTYGGVRGRKTKVGRKLLRFPPTRFLFNLAGRFLFYSAALIFDMLNAETLPSGETVALILKWLVFLVPSVS